MKPRHRKTEEGFINCLHKAAKLYPGKFKESLSQRSSCTSASQTGNSKKLLILVVILATVSVINTQNFPLRRALIFDMDATANTVATFKTLAPYGNIICVGSSERKIGLMQVVG